METPRQPVIAVISPPTSDNVALAAAAILRGEVVGMPTETVYGLAGNAFDPRAIARIFEAKERPTFDPLIVHVSPGLLGDRTVARLAHLRLVDETGLSPAARAHAEKLMRTFWPGPLTLVLPKHASVPELVTGGLDTVGLRMPRHPVAQALIDAAQTALAAPSANRFGRISPTEARHVADELGDRIGLILDGGACEIGLESTVLFINPSDGAIGLLRPGGVPVEEIEAALNLRAQAPARTGALLAPGMLESHYAPRKRVFILPSLIGALSVPAFRAWFTALGGAPASVSLLLQAGAPAALAHYFEQISSLDVTLALSLSESGDLGESARTLFRALRELDAAPGDAIFAEPCAGTHGLGHAIADRLRRAAATRPS